MESDLFKFVLVLSFPALSLALIQLPARVRNVSGGNLHTAEAAVSPTTPTRCCCGLVLLCTLGSVSLCRYLVGIVK